MVHTTCAALHCLSSSHTDKDLKFHQFPHDAERRKIWITACQRTDVIDKDWDFFKHKYVCSLHFQKCMYGKKDRLKKSAIPSLHLSEKPLQHDSSTQTVKSIQYVNQQSENDASISYVMLNVENNSTTTHTQAEDSLPYDINQINIKEVIITPTQIKESELVEQDVEIKREKYCKNSDLGPRVPILFEEDIEMKIETVGNEILPLVQSTQYLRSDDLKRIKDGGTLSSDGTVKARVAECVEGTAAECGGVVAPVVIAGNLSEKPLQHGSSTQTVKSIQNVNQRSENGVTISYVMSNVENNSTATHTQAEDSLPSDINQVNIKEGIITPTQIEESESVEQDVEIKTENDDKNSDSSSRVPILFEEDVEMKTGGNEILPLVQSTQSLQTDDLEIIKDGGRLSSNGSMKEGVAECVEGTATECGEAVAPDIVIAGTLLEKPLKHDSFTQTVESIQYVNQQSENDVSIMYVMPNLEKSPTTTYTQTEDSLPYDINHVNIEKEKIIHTKIEESESVQQDVEIKTENDDENRDSGACEEDVEMKIDIVENEILPLVQSTQYLQSDDLEIKKGGGTLSTQARNLVQEISQGLTAAIINRTSTNPLNTTMMPILKRKMDGSIQTDRVIVLSRNADGSARSINPEECTCNRNDYIDMTRLQFYRACSKFLSGNFAINVRRQMHLDDVTKQGGNKLCEAGSSRSVKAGMADCVELNAAGCGVLSDVVNAGTATADSAEAGLYADRVEANAAASGTDCARRLVICNIAEMPEGRDLETPLHPKRMRMQPSNLVPVPPSSPSAAPPSRASFSVPSPAITPIKLRINQNPEGRILITSAVELTNTPKVSIRPKQDEQCKHVGPLERAAACDLDKEDRDVIENDPYNHLRQSVNELSPSGSLQGIPRTCRTPVSKMYSGVIRNRKRKNQRKLVTAPAAEGSDFDSDIDDNFDLDEITSFGGRPRNIPADDDLDESVCKIVNLVERAMDDAIDQLVGVPSDFNWRADFDTFQGVPEDFSGPTPGPIEEYDTPYDAFTAIWSNDIIERIVIETNRYAKQVIDEKKKAGTLKRSSRLRCWTDTDKDEVYVFFALHILMGLDQRITQQEFWNSTGYLEMPKFRKLMKYRRFLLLNRCFHFEDNSGASQDLSQSGGNVLPAKLRKIAPIFGHLNNKFSSLYNLHAHIAIDESLTKGRLSWAQAIRSKTAWNGIKSYELCDSSTGYLYKFEICTGMNSKQGHFAPLSEALAEKSTQLVMDLLTGLETRGHCITMDNFYNSPALARHLKSLGFDCLGTLRPNRKNVPLEIKNVPKNMAKGTTIARHCGDVSCIAWKDTKMVTMISTYHTSKMCIDAKAGRALVLPVVIRDYNNTMKGVNLKDQKLSTYFFERKRRKRCQKWYLKIFIRLLNVSVRNAFILLSGSLNRRGMPLCTDRDFREELANSLLANRRLSPEEILAPIEEKYTRLRKDILHVPKYHTDNANRWRCFICYRRGIEKMVYSSCVTCNEFICFEGCWSDWHSLQKLPKRDNYVSCQKKKRYT